MINNQNFDELIGKKFTLFKSNLSNHFQLDNTLYEVLEDESDGYRSCMKHVGIVDDNADTDSYSEDLGEVIIEKAPKREDIEDNWDYDFEGWLIKSTQDNHIWLKFGTDNVDDYYPSFVFNWQPKIKV